MGGVRALLRALEWRGFLLCAVFACIFALGDATDGLLTAWGQDASGNELLYLDLPAMVVAEGVLARENLFMTLLPVGVALALAAPVRTGFVQLLVIREGARRTVLQIVLVGMLLGGLFGAVVAGVILVVCVLACPVCVDSAVLSELVRAGAPIVAPVVLYPLSMGTRLLLGAAVSCVVAAVTCVMGAGVASLAPVPVSWGVLTYVGPVAEAVQTFSLCRGVSPLDVMGWDLMALSMMGEDVVSFLARIVTSLLLLAFLMAAIALLRPSAFILRGARA